jgi:predicted GNAT family N-acyltransferase
MPMPPADTQKLPMIDLKPWADAQEDAFRVRKTVFIEEKGVPEEMEIDEFDPIAIHALAYIDAECVGTARLICRLAGSEGGRSIGRIGRMAVLAPYRGHGLGRALIEVLLEYGQSQGLRSFELHAQLDALAFYERLGFIPRGDIYDEVGIPHRDMILLLS